MGVWISLTESVSKPLHAFLRHTIFKEQLRFNNMRLRWTSTVNFRLTFVGVCLLLAAWSLYAPTRNASVLETVDIGALHRGKSPDSTWIKVSGRLLWEQAVDVRGRQSHTAYVPMVPRSWDHDSSVKLIVQISPNKEKQLGSYAEVQGMISGSVPGIASDAFGKGALSESCICLTEGQDPGTTQRLATVLFLFGGVFAGVGTMKLWAPMFNWESSAAGSKTRKATPEEEVRKIAREEEHANSISNWLASRGIASGSGKS